AQILAEAKAPVVGGARLAVTPDREQRRARPVLPAQHDIRAQLAKAEVGPTEAVRAVLSHRERAVHELAVRVDRAEPITELIGTRVVDVLVLAVATRRDERLRVRLQAELR